MSSLHYKYVLVGGGVASSSAARAIRERDADGSMLLVGQEVNRPYNRPPLSKGYLRGQTPKAELFTLPDDWFVQNRVDLKTGRRVTMLDVARSSVSLDNGQDILFDRLLIATGGSARKLKIPGAELPNVFSLRQIEDADRLRNAVEQARREGRPHDRGRGRAGIIGDGVLGVELAATLTQLGLAVDLVFSASHPWHKFAGETAGRFMGRYLEAHGVKLHPGSNPVRLEGDGRAQRIVLGNGATGSIDCDLIVAAIGMEPHRELVRGTSIAAEKAILADDHCRTSAEGIYAAGDCAAVYDSLFGKYRLVDHWESAIETGRLAGLNMAGGDVRYDWANHYFTDVFDLGVSVWGEARAVERRIVRGQQNPDAPDFLEIGVAADGRIAEIIAVGHAGEDDLLRELVKRRVNVSGREALLRDPQWELKGLESRL